MNDGPGRPELYRESGQRKQEYVRIVPAIPHSGIAGANKLRGSTEDTVYPRVMDGSGRYVDPSIRHLEPQQYPRSFVLQPGQRYVGISVIHSVSQKQAESHNQNSGPQEWRGRGTSTYHPELSKEQIFSMWASLHGNGSVSREAIAELFARRNQPLDRGNSPGTTSTIDVPAPCSNLLHTPVSTPSPNSAETVFPMKGKQVNSGGDNSRAKYGPVHNMAPHFRCEDSAFCTPEDPRVNGTAENCIDPNNETGGRRSDFVIPETVNHNHTGSPILRTSSQPRIVVSNQNPVPPEGSDNIKPQKFVNHGKVAGASSPILSGQPVGNSAIITGSRVQHILPKKREVRVCMAPPKKRKVISLPNGKSTQPLKPGRAASVPSDLQENVQREPKSSRRTINRVSSALGNEQIHKGATRESARRTTKKDYASDSTGENQKAEKCNGLVEVIDVDEPDTSDSSAARASQSLAHPSKPVTSSHQKSEQPEPLVPLVPLPAKVCLPRRVPYPRPIAPRPRPPPERMEDSATRERIRKRFGDVEEGYIFHHRCGWLMHPSFYGPELPLCDMKTTCPHSRDCREVRKRMAILACIKQRISYRESEYIWGVSRSCIQRNTKGHNGKISISFLLTPFR